MHAQRLRPGRRAAQTQFEAEARNRLGPARAALITGSDRTVTDRITLRPQLAPL